MTKSVSKKVLALAVSAAILFLSMSFAADNVHAAEQVKVTVSAKTISEFDIVQKEITVTSDAFEHFYPDLADKDGKGVTYADALVAAHIDKYGDKFKSNPGGYLKFSDDYYAQYHSISVVKQFEHSKVGLYYNNQKLASAVNEEKLSDADFLEVVSFEKNYSECYSRFGDKEYAGIAGDDIAVKIIADYCGNSYKPNNGAELYTVDFNTGALNKLSKKADGNGDAVLKFDKKGTYYITAKGKVTYPDWNGNASTANIVLPLAKVTVAKAIKLKKPELKIKLTSNKKSMASWSKVKCAEKYQIKYKAGGSGKWSVKTVSKRKIGFDRLRAGKKYYYKVCALVYSYGKTIYSPYSRTKSVTTLGSAKRLKISAESGKYLLSWHKVAAAEGYDKKVRSKYEKKWNTIKQGTKLSESKFKTIGYMPGKTYQYRVRAYKSVGGKKIYGPWSNIVTIKRY